jgi:hypothetical protein
MGRGAQNGTRKGLIAWAKLIAQRASRKAPVASGELSRSIFAGTTRRGIAGGGVETVEIDVVAGEKGVDFNKNLVGTNLSYAAAQELGSGLHGERGSTYPITSRPGGPPLAFEWEGAPAAVEHMRDPKSGLFFFRKVDHPGVKAQPYLRPAFFESFDEGLDGIVEAILAEWSKPVRILGATVINTPQNPGFTPVSTKTLRLRLFGQQAIGDRMRRKFGGEHVRIRKELRAWQ